VSDAIKALHEAATVLHWRRDTVLDLARSNRKLLQSQVVGVRDSSDAASLVHIAHHLAVYLAETETCNRAMTGLVKALKEVGGELPDGVPAIVEPEWAT
jgi:hypothetical protein